MTCLQQEAGTEGPAVVETAPAANGGNPDSTSVTRAEAREEGEGEKKEAAQEQGAANGANDSNGKVEAPSPDDSAGGSQEPIKSALKFNTKWSLPPQKESQREVRSSSAVQKSFVVHDSCMLRSVGSAIDVVARIEAAWNVLVCTTYVVPACLDSHSGEK